MSVFRRSDTKHWAYRRMVRLPNGKTKRISGTPEINSKGAAEKEEALHIARLKEPAKPEVPPFGEWFNGRFWNEWVVARKNKPSESGSKRSIYDHHLAARFGKMPLDEINVAEIARFRGDLVSETDKAGNPVRGAKTVNNILAVLSKALKYAEDVHLIARAPKVGLFKTERPEMEPWEIEEYARLVEAARTYKAHWYLGVLLAGEAGLRVGEVKALRWSDVDLRGRTLTVAQQVRRGEIGTPKGRTRRVVPLTKALQAALEAVRARATYVLGGDEPVTEDAAQFAIEYICGRAGLPLRRWHTLRHSFGTHAAMLGVNPWSLMTWMGHKQLTETLLYVHHAKSHTRTVPRKILEAAGAEVDPDRRLILQLGARSAFVSGTVVALTPAKRKKLQRLR